MAILLFSNSIKHKEVSKTMKTADTVIGILLLGGAFVIFTIMNYRILFLRIRDKDSYVPSPAPLIGGLAGAILVIALSGSSHPLLILLPLLIDPGSIPLIIELIIRLIRR